MRVPDVLAIQLPRGDQHGKLLDFLGQRGFFAQVVVQEGGPLVRLRHVDEDGTWAIAWYRSKSLHHLIEGRPLGFGNTLSRRQGSLATVISQFAGLDFSFSRKACRSGASSRSRHWHTAWRSRPRSSLGARPESLRCARPPWGWSRQRPECG